MYTILALILIPCAALAALVLTRKPKPTIFTNAYDLISDPTTWHRGGFTPNGLNGVGNMALPHCVLAAVAASDPAFDPDEPLVYDLDSVKHLERVAMDVYGTNPGVVNDKLGHAAALNLLVEANKRL